MGELAEKITTKITLQKLHQKSTATTTATMVAMHFVEHFACGILIVFFTQVLKKNVVCSDARLDFDRFDDMMEGDSFHCELVTISVVSPPSKLRFNTATLCQNHLIAQSYLKMQHASMLHILSLWSSWTPWSSLELVEAMDKSGGGLKDGDEI